MAAGKVYPASGLGIVDVAWHADRKFAVVRLDDGDSWRVKVGTHHEAKWLGEMDRNEFTRWCDLKNQQLYPEKIAKKLTNETVKEISHDPLDFSFGGY